MTAVRLENLCKEFGAFCAVDSVNLSINSGEFIVFVGPSGSGKTTCLRMVAGLESTTSGSIYIGDRDVANVHAKDRDVAMVFQSYALYPHMTVADNMGFALKLRKVPKTEINKRIQNAAEILDISDKLDRKPKTLSGGQQQRVALGRAIVRDPAVFLFDEPLSNLDAKLRVAMRSEIIKLHRRLSATMIYVTHDQIEAMTMADRVVVMNLGRIQQVGTPLELYDNPNSVFVAGFIGSPPMNMIDGEIDQTDDLISFRSSGFNIDLPAHHEVRNAGRSTVLGIRPEFISIEPRPEALSIETKVDAVEHLGAETIVELLTPGLGLTAKLPRNDSICLGDILPIFLDPNQILAFDKTTGSRCSLAGSRSVRLEDF